MCIRNRAHDLGSASNTNNSVIKHPIRKIRTKTRRPKFLSLRLELTPPRNSTPMSPRPKPPALQEQQQQQLTLFPLHPENMVEDRDSMHDENVALMFNSDVVSSCCSLQSLSFLPSYQNDMSSTEEESRNLVGGREAEGGSWLVRAAMRSREREAAEEEKWVCYSEVVEKKEEEVTSTAADEWVEKKYINKKKNKMEIIGKQKQKQKQLRLKLDYEGILNAWSDKAPLYINGESPQTVPNLHDDQIFSSDSLPNVRSFSVCLYTRFARPCDPL